MIWMVLFFFWFPISSVSFPNPWSQFLAQQQQLEYQDDGHYHPHNQQFFQLSGKIQVFFYLFVLFDFATSLLKLQNPQNDKFIYLFILFIYLFILIYLTWPGWNDPYVTPNHNEFCESSFRGQNLCCKYTINQYNQVLISCTIPNE